MVEKIAELENIEALHKILNEEGELNNKNLFQMMLAHQFKNKELVNKDGNLLLTVDSLIRINNHITDSQNIQLRRINVKPAFYNKQYMDFTRIESVLVDQFNERQITPRTFCDIFLDEIHPFQMEMAEPVKFYSKTRSNISMNSIKSLFFPMKFLCRTINYFFKNYAAFFININRHKNYIEFKRNFLFLLMKLYLIFIEIKS